MVSLTYFEKETKSENWNLDFVLYHGPLVESLDLLQLRARLREKF